MDNMKYDLIFEPDEEMEKFVAENPVTHALLSHLIDELEEMNQNIGNWAYLTDVVLAAAAFSFYRAGGTNDEFMEKLQSVDIRPDISKLNLEKLWKY